MAALSFPADPATFDSDERISFSKLDSRFLAVHDDGTEFEFDAQLRRWIPIIDDEFIKNQRAYHGDPGPDDDVTGAIKKRKKDGDSGPRKKQKQKQKPPSQPRENTAVYVTNLPFDAISDQVHDVFSRKCGVIAEEIDSGKPRIKMYTDAKGNFKGDALVVFFKPQSVQMAIMLLDEADFRFEASGTGGSGKMRVQAADSSYKKVQYEQSQEGGDAVTSEKPKEKVDHRAREQQKQKIIKRTQKLDAKLADWDDDQLYGAQLETKARKDRLVTLRHMFTLKELDEDPAALLEIKADVRDECSKLGVVTNVVLYDLEEEGIMSVKFKTAGEAEACVRMMDGRAFDGRTVRATIASGREKFRKSGKKQGDQVVDEAEDEDKDETAEAA